MSTSSKQQLLHYLEFLKTSGYLYLEPEDGRVPRGSADRLKPGHPNEEAGSGVPPSGGNSDLTPDPGERDLRVAKMMAAAARAERCRACPLGATRDRLVYGDGDPTAKIVFVGEAPGGEENATGIPFVGRAGQLLNKMIAAIGFKREEVYICNTLKCRPPGNRDPFPTEKAACEPFLVEQLEILRPQILVALGAHAAQYLCRKEMPIGKLRGRWYEYHGVALLATFHPAFLLRNGTYKPQSWDDFQTIHAKYCELNPGDQREIWRKKE